MSTEIRAGVPDVPNPDLALFAATTCIGSPNNTGALDVLRSRAPRKAVLAGDGAAQADVFPAPLPAQRARPNRLAEGRCRGESMLLALERACLLHHRCPHAP